MACPSTSSITMTKEVSGAWAAAAGKPTIPAAIGDGVCGACSNRAISLPKPAPIAREGEKFPTGTPEPALMARKHRRFT